MDTTDRSTAPARRKVSVPDPRTGAAVPFVEVVLSDSAGPGGSVPNEPVRLYDTSGPGSVPTEGLAPLRRPWILERGDVEEIEGRRPTLRDDGRGAVRRGDPAGGPGTTIPGAGRRPLRATGGAVTQMAYARRGEITPEMSFVAVREGVEPEVVRDEIAAGRAILPANINHPESEPMVIGSRF
ncbi:MAG: phosphomethylpyrimidine synthase ThiC, partial [Actinomycetota bacterium]|nr:phosphomethylpyrimidine synthase ThiC [Actinomycetota bacterium]